MVMMVLLFSVSGDEKYDTPAVAAGSHDDRPLKVGQSWLASRLQNGRIRRVLEDLKEEVDHVVGGIGPKKRRGAPSQCTLSPRKRQKPLGDFGRPFYIIRFYVIVLNVET